MNETKSKVEFKALCKKVFAALDTNNNGSIDRAECSMFLRKLYPKADIEELEEMEGKVDLIMTKMNAGSDGKVDFKGFRDYMIQSSKCINDESESSDEEGVEALKTYEEDAYEKALGGIMYS